MATLADIRAQYPQYEDLSDKQIADGLYAKHYSDMPRDQFDQKIGFELDPGDRTRKRMDDLERDIGTIAKDIGAKAAAGANAMVGNVADIYGLATGDMDNPVSEQAKSGREYWEAKVSPELKAQEADRKAAIDAADGEWAKAGTAVWETLKNPALLSSSLAEQAAQLVPMAGAGRVAGAAAKALGASTGVATGAAVAGGVGAGAAMQGADTGGDAYDRLMALPEPMWQQNQDVQTLIAHGMTPQEAKQRVAVRLSRDSAAIAAIASGALNMLPGARVLEKSLAGVPSAGGMAGRAVSGLVGEGLQEGLEEGTGMAAQNRAVQGIDPNQPLTQGVGEAAGMGAVVGGPMGGVAGLSGGQTIQPPAVAGANPSVSDLIGEDVGTPATMNAEGGTSVPGPTLPDFIPAPITDANSPAVRGWAEDVDPEQVELAPPLPQSDLANATDELAGNMRTPPPASNVDVAEQDMPVTQVELAPPPVEQPLPVEPPASNIDLAEPYDSIEEIDAAPAPQPQRALPPPAMAVDSEGNAQPQAQAEQARRAFTQKERLQYEQLTKRAAKLEAQGDTEGAIAIRRKMVGLEQQTVVKPPLPLPAPVMAVDSQGNAAFQSERDNAAARQQAEAADIDRRATELERAGKPEEAIALRREAIGYTQPEGDNARADRSRAERLPPDWTDNRLARAPYRYGLRQMADSIEKGGGIAYKQDENGTITGRTPSLNPTWFQSMQQNPDYKMSVAEVQKAVEKALSGKKLGVREARVVGVMLDQQRGERSEQVDYAKGQLEAARKFRKTAAEAIGITDKDVEQAGELFNEPEYRAEWDGPTRALFELADDARAIDAAATDAILESNASDSQVARRLTEIINGRTVRAPQADPAETAGQRETEAPAQAQGAEEARARGAEDGAVAAKTSRAPGGAQNAVETANQSTSAPNEKVSGKENRARTVLREKPTSGAAKQIEAKVKRPKPAPLYASRPVTNAADIIAWAKEQGFTSTLSPDDLHVTVAYSREPVNGASVKPASKKLSTSGGKRSVEKLGDEGAVVLKFENPGMQKRWQQYRDAGASWDYDSYMPHVTITYDGGKVDLSKVKPYDGPIELGEEKQEPLNLDKADEYKETEKPTSGAAAQLKEKKDRQNLKSATTGRQQQPAENADEDAKTTANTAKSTTTTPKLADFGEKLEGARKDYATRLKEAQDVDIAKEPLSKSWPEPDYAKLIEEGANPAIVAFVHAARDEIPTKPQRSYKLSRWVEQVKLLRDFSEKLISGDIDAGKLAEALEKPGFSTVAEQVGGRAALYERVGHERSLKGIGISAGKYSMYGGKTFDPPKTIWTVDKKAKATAFSNWPTTLGTGDTKQAAIDDFVKKFETMDAKVEKEVKFTIYAYKSDPNRAVIGKKIGSSYIDLKTFDSTTEAREYLAKHKDELIALLDAKKNIPSERRANNEPRVGIDHRGGADVTPEQFTEAFSFRGVQFGNYVESVRRQADLNEAYDALMDLAGIIGVPPRALSLNGEMGLAFGARGRGGKNPYSAHYEAGTIVINLTKNRGAGSLAHEWWHGLDNYFARQGGRRDEFVTDGNFRLDIRPEMIEAFKGVRGAVNNAALKKRSSRVDARRSKPYWATGLELSARSFESYVIAKLHDQGKANDYLANIVDQAVWDAAMGEENTYPYPTADEVPAIRAAFDEFFRTVETRETDKGVGMFAARDSRDAHRWTQVTDTPNGPLFQGNGFTLFPAYPYPNVWKTTGYIILDENGQRVGKVTLRTDNGQVTDLYWINAYEQGSGLGRRVMAGITASNDGPVAIHSVLPTARKFWDKIGAYDYVGEEKPDATLDWDAYQRATQGRDGLARDEGRAAQSQPRNAGALRQGLTPESVQAYLETKVGPKVVKRLLDSGRLKILASNSAELPADVKNAIGEGDMVFGYTENGVTYLIADNLNDKGAATKTSEDAYAILLHETGVHYGMPAMLGDKLFSSVIAEAKAAKGELGKAWAAARKMVPRGTNPAHVDEETLAWMVTDRANHELPLIKRVIAKLRAWLISKGFVKAMDADSLVELARGAAARAGGRAGGTRFAAKDTDAFKRWFGDSKVVDENGDPLVVYHGTRYSFDEFDASKATGLRQGAEGFYFSRFAEDASGYAGTGPTEGANVMPVYLSIQNPVIANGRDMSHTILSPKQIAEYEEEGYDGMIVNDGEEVIAFRPNQIKSATGNNGNFDPNESDIRFARRAADDIATAVDSPAIKKGLKQWYKDTGAAVVNAIDAKLTPLATMVGRTEYLTSRYLTLGRIAQTQQEARRVYDLFRKLSDADGQKVYAYLTDTEGTLEGVDPIIKANATRVKGMIEETGRALVERGVIPQESFYKYQGRYLPRVYLAYLLGDKAVAAVGAGKTLSAQGYAKSRDENLPQEYRDLVLGEIKDPAFLASRALGVPLRDLAILNWLSKIAQNPNWVLPGQTVEWTMPGFDKPRTVTPYWLKSEATSLRERAQHYAGQNKLDAMRLAAEMDETADAALSEAGISADQVPDGYKQIPNSARYGAVRGLIVVKDIYDDIVGVGQITREMSMPERVLAGDIGRKVTAWWKISKVSLNPPAQVRNVISNLVLLNLSGVPLYKIPSLVARAAKEVRTKGKYYQIGVKYGITESTFAAQEMQRIERETKDYLARQNGRFSLAGLSDYGARMVEWAGDKYQLSEMMGKLVKIMDSMEREGKSEADAAMAAQEWLFDYSLVGQKTRYLRSAPIGAPFLTFAIKVLPRILEVAITHPARFLPYWGMFYGMQLLAESLTGADDDDLEKLEKALPEWLQEKGHVMMLPFKDGNGRWQFLDMGYFFPWTYWTEIARGMGKSVKELASGETDALGKILTGSGLLGGPIPDLLTALKSGKDSFTGREILDKNMTAGEKWSARLAYLYGMAAPPWLTGVLFHDHATSKGAAGHIYEALTGATDKRGDPRSTLPQALLRLVGVNIYGVEPEKQRKLNVMYKKYEISKTMQLMRSIAKDKSIDQEDRDELVEDYKAKIRRQKEALDKYIKDSAVAPELR